jgi:hypothetical protein
MDADSRPSTKRQIPVRFGSVWQINELLLRVDSRLLAKSYIRISCSSGLGR